MYLPAEHESPECTIGLTVRTVYLHIGQERKRLLHTSSCTSHRGYLTLLRAEPTHVVTPSPPRVRRPADQRPTAPPVSFRSSNRLCRSPEAVRLGNDAPRGRHGIPAALSPHPPEKTARPHTTCQRFRGPATVQRCSGPGGYVARSPTA